MSTSLTSASLANNVDAPSISHSVGSPANSLASFYASEYPPDCVNYHTEVFTCTSGTGGYYNGALNTLPGFTTQVLDRYMRVSLEAINVVIHPRSNNSRAAYGLTHNPVAGAITESTVYTQKSAFGARNTDLTQISENRDLMLLTGMSGFAKPAPLIAVMPSLLLWCNGPCDLYIRLYYKMGGPIITNATTALTSISNVP